MSILKALLVTAIILILIIVLSTPFLVRYLDNPVLVQSAGNEEDSGDVLSRTFQISRGETLSLIARRLETEGHIRSSRFLIFYAQLKGTQTSFKIGTYAVDPAMTTRQIHDMLVDGRQQLYRITIPEGWTSRRIGLLLEKEGIVSLEKFLKAVETPSIISRFPLPVDSLEGFLFPDTYFFQQDYPAERVIIHMVEKFFTHLELIAPNYHGYSSEELYQRVVLASIIEREYRDASEAALMASVFYNRLDRGIALGSCATVVYVMTEIEGKKHPEFLTYRDLEISSPYNTYIHRGLPPGPIANPGRVALDAVFYPEDSDYLYFLLMDPTAGRHHFSRTFAEHNQAHRLYIKRN